MKQKAIDIPSHILAAIGKGECTLFLGAGASNPAGAPSGEALCNLITDKFLAAKGDKPKLKGSVSLATDWGLNLASAVSLACAQTGIRADIESFVGKNLSKSAPSSAHLKIPWFRWRAIVTTNYDRLIERAYENEKGKVVQELIPVLKEDELHKIGATSSEMVPLLKPHGSVSDPHSMSLSLEDIYQAKQDRRLLFTYVEILHLVGPVIYVGYSFKDIHILDMIYDLTRRLGPYRKPILFVTLQKDLERADKERRWIEGPLKGIYLAEGFEQFMDALSKQITPAILPSMIIKQMAPCKTMTFASNGLVSDTGFYKIDQHKKGEWEYWLTYSIDHQEGYAGVIFERKDQNIDIRNYGRIRLELNIPKGERNNEAIEAKLEGMVKQYELQLDIKKLKGKGWKGITLPFGRKRVPTPQLQRLVLADTGHRVMLGREYKIGIRKIRFEELNDLAATKRQRIARSGRH
jgi:SIR2-like domain